MSFWKKLGKIAAFAAPIIAAPFTGGLSLAAIGAGAGAASAAMDHKGLKGMLLNAGLGAIPGIGKAATATKGLTAIEKMAISSGLGAAGGAATGGKKGALLGAGLAAAGSKFGGSGGNVAGNSSGGVMSKLLDSGKQALLGNGAGSNGMAGGLLQQLLSGDTINAAGKGVGSISQTMAHNRGSKLDAMMAADTMNMAQAQDRRADESDMLKKMSILNYIQSGGAHVGEPTTGHSGKFTSFDFGVRPSSEGQKQMAGTMQGQLMDRLNNPAKLRNYDEYMDPSGTEKALDWLGPILTTVGVARGAGKYQDPLAQRGVKPTTQIPQTAGGFPIPGTPLPPEGPPMPFVPGVTLDNNF